MAGANQSESMSEVSIQRVSSVPQQTTSNVSMSAAATTMQQQIQMQTQSLRAQSSPPLAPTNYGYSGSNMIGSGQGSVTSIQPSFDGISKASSVPAAGENEQERR
jgi:hypothetical protein